jgi:hypothetical protein
VYLVEFNYFDFVFECILFYTIQHFDFVLIESRGITFHFVLIESRGIAFHFVLMNKEE